MKTEYFAKLIIGALNSDQQWLEQAKIEMQRLNWIIQLQSEELPFDKTDYYTREMGRELKRCFLSIEGLQSLGCSVDWKFKTLEMCVCFYLNQGIWKLEIWALVIDNWKTRFVWNWEFRLGEPC